MHMPIAHNVYIINWKKIVIKFPFWEFKNQMLKIITSAPLVRTAIEGVQKRSNLSKFVIGHL